MLSTIVFLSLLANALAHPAPAPSAVLHVREMIDQPVTMGGPFSDKPETNISAVVFPKSVDWFTLEVTNYVLWSWGESYNPQLRVVLTHTDTNLLRGPLMLDDKVFANMFGTVYNRTLEAAPGSGYRIELHDFANVSRIYATSEPFEIKPAGSKPTVPPPYGPQPLPTAALKSGAVRKAVAGACAAAAVMLAVVL